MWTNRQLIMTVRAPLLSIANPAQLVWPTTALRAATEAYAANVRYSGLRCRNNELSSDDSLFRFVSDSFRFSLDSINLASFSFRLARSIIPSIDSTSFVVFRVISTTVHLPHDFVFYRVLIVEPVEVAIDSLIASHWFKTNFKFKINSSLNFGAGRNH